MVQVLYDKHIPKNIAPKCFEFYNRSMLICEYRKDVIEYPDNDVTFSILVILKNLKCLEFQKASMQLKHSYLYILQKI